MANARTTESLSDLDILARIEQERECIKCGVVYPIDHYAKNPRSLNGRRRGCRSCNTAQHAAWVDENRDKVRAIDKARKNKEERRAVCTAYYHARKLSDRDHINQKNRESYKRNRAIDPSKHTARTSKYRARKIQRTPAWADEAKISLAYSLANKLTKATGITHEVDHGYPLNGYLVSGLHVHQNLVVVAADYNRAKHNRLIEVRQ